MVKINMSNKTAFLKIQSNTENMYDYINLSFARLDAGIECLIIDDFVQELSLNHYKVILNNKLYSRIHQEWHESSIEQDLLLFVKSNKRFYLYLHKDGIKIDILSIFLKDIELTYKDGQLQKDLMQLQKDFQTVNLNNIFTDSILYNLNLGLSDEPNIENIADSEVELNLDEMTNKYKYIVSHKIIRFKSKKKIFISNLNKSQAEYLSDEEFKIVYFIHKRENYSLVFINFFIRNA